ncbi:MAG: hypothetical protein QGH45_07370 [Myxococcota bacterium]|nr:hypothetical protein [Myxococcota bacterium]
MRRMVACALALAFVAAPTTMAFAQAEDDDEERKPRVIYQKETEIDFLEGRNIEGALLGPSIGDIFVPKEPVFTPLLKLRGHFNPEIEQSVNQL